MNIRGVNGLLAPPGQAEKHSFRMFGFSFVIQTYTHTHILFTLPSEKPQQMGSLGAQACWMRRSLLKGQLAGTEWGRESDEQLVWLITMFKILLTDTNLKNAFQRG